MTEKIGTPNVHSLVRSHGGRDGAIVPAPFDVCAWKPFVAPPSVPALFSKSAKKFNRLRTKENDRRHMARFAHTYNY